MFWLFKKSKKLQNNSNEKESKVPNFEDSVAKKILQNIKNEFGLDYSKQEYITMKKIERFALQNEIYDFKELLTLLDKNNDLKEKLVNLLTVGETYFYRELGHFNVLSSFMKEKNIKNILCAPSSSGEEAYSIVIYLLENLNKNFDLKVQGIDLNSDSIKIAKTASYSQRSVSLMPQDVVTRYFNLENSRYNLSKEVTRHVTFAQQNIFEDSLYNLGTFDAIFCRNMLIYFDDKEKKEVLKRLHKILKPRGILFLGHADISFVPDNFTKETNKEGTFYIAIAILEQTFLSSFG